MILIKKIIPIFKKSNVVDESTILFFKRAANGFTWNCKHGYLTVAQWLYDSQLSDCKYNIFYSMHEACKYGQLKTAQWLFSIFSCTHKISPNCCWLYACCTSGNLKLVQWMYLIYTQNNIKVCNDQALEIFKEVCTIGHLGVARWFYSIKIIDIGTNFEDEFVACCEHGHINLAKWLYSIKGINFDKRMIRSVCRFWRYRYVSTYSTSHIRELYQWLQQILSALRISSPHEINEWSKNLIII